MFRLALACLAACLVCCAGQLKVDDLNVPPGFSVNVFANDTWGARSLAISRNTTYPGTVLYVSTDTSGDPNHRSQNGTLTGPELAGRVYGLLDSRNTGTSERTVILLSGQNDPNGIAWHNGSLYVAELNKITRYDNADSYVVANKPFDEAAGTVIFDGLPNVTHHGNRYMRISPTGRLFFDTGAPCNDCILEKAFGNVTFGSLNSMALNGTDIQPYAQGIRNTVGFDWDADGKLYFTNNGIDQLGNDSPDDTLNVAPSPGLFFGFPYCHALGVGSSFLRTPGVVKPLADPTFSPVNSTEPGANMAFCSQAAQAPVQALGPHVAALGMRFWYGAGYPAEYNGSVFIAEHGSWARETKIGYRVVAVMFAANGTVTNHEVFVEGFLERNQTAWGRPVDVEVSNMGLLISDDQGGAVYRVAYNTSFDAAVATFAPTQVKPSEVGPP